MTSLQPCCRESPPSPLPARAARTPGAFRLGLRTRAGRLLPSPPPQRTAGTGLCRGECVPRSPPEQRAASVCRDGQRVGAMTPRGRAWGRPPGLTPGLCAGGVLSTPRAAGRGGGRSSVAQRVPPLGMWSPRTWTSALRPLGWNFGPTEALGQQLLSRDLGAPSRACHGHGRASQKVLTACGPGLSIRHNTESLMASGTRANSKPPRLRVPGQQPHASPCNRRPPTLWSNAGKTSARTSHCSPSYTSAFCPASRVAFLSLCASHGGRLKNVLETPGQNEHTGGPRAPTPCSRRDPRPLWLP